MRTITITISEHYYQMCYDLYYNTEMKDKYTWEEALGLMCTYGIAAIWNCYMQVQCRDIYEVERNWRTEFCPKEINCEKVNKTNKSNSNDGGVH